MGWWSLAKRTMKSGLLGLALFTSGTAPTSSSAVCTSVYDQLLVNMDSTTRETLRSLSKAKIISADAAPAEKPADARTKLEAYLSQIAQEDLLYQKQKNLQTVYDTLGNSEQKALAQRFNLEIPNLIIVTGAKEFFEYQLKTYGASTLNDSIIVAQDMLRGHYAAYLDHSGAPYTGDFFSMKLRVNPFTKGEPRRIALHEKTHALQFSRYHGGLAASCFASSEACMNSWEGQADYFEDWLSKTASFDKATEDSLALQLLASSVREMPSTVNKNLTLNEFITYNRYQRSRALFAALVVDKGLDSATYLFTAYPPCKLSTLPASTTRTGQPR